MIAYNTNELSTILKISRSKLDYLFYKYNMEKPKNTSIKNRPEYIVDDDYIKYAGKFIKDYDDKPDMRKCARNRVYAKRFPKALHTGTNGADWVRNQEKRQAMIDREYDSCHGFIYQR